MDIRYISPFLAAAQKVFDTMIDMPFALGKPRLKEDSRPSYGISAIIGLSGQIKGSIVVSLSEELALQMSSAMLGEKVTEMNSDCTDVIGEITNMITGNAISDLPEDHISISTPSIILGQPKVHFPSKVPIVTIPCKAGGADLVIDVGFKADDGTSK